MVQSPIPDDLGERAYAAYSEATDGLTYDGRLMPAWNDLGERIQNAWTAATKVAYDAGLAGGS